jgi:hypothetical protein
MIRAREISAMVAHLQGKRIACLFFGQTHKENSQQAVRLPYNLKT